jgi:hypothetical protein
MRMKQVPPACSKWTQQMHNRLLTAQLSLLRLWRKPTRPKAAHPPNHALEMATLLPGQRGQPGAQQRILPLGGVQLYPTRR